MWLLMRSLLIWLWLVPLRNYFLYTPCTSVCRVWEARSELNITCVCVFVVSGGSSCWNLTQQSVPFTRQLVASDGLPLAEPQESSCSHENAFSCGLTHGWIWLNWWLSVWMDMILSECGWEHLDKFLRVTIPNTLFCGASMALLVMNPTEICFHRFSEEKLEEIGTRLEECGFALSFCL
jgi:hypothetical protein